MSPVAEPGASRRRMRALTWLIPLALVAVGAAVLLARLILGTPAVQDFTRTYPGLSAQPAETPVGFPAWLSWAHFLNALFLLLIVRSGWRIRSKQRPPAFVTRDPSRLPGRLLGTATPPKRLSVHTWWHLVVDTLFVLNGAIYLVLLFASGHWARVVPTSWDVFPNAVTVGLQYVSLQWPDHNGWVQYNALQLLAYFATVFLAGPLALLTGLRLSPGWKPGWRVNRVYTDAVARRVHTAVLWYFVAFTVFHVGLVLATGAVRNLNHMYAGRDDSAWIGAAVFAGSVVVMAVVWAVATPIMQARLAGATGNAVRMMPPAPKRG